jgi:hypothetical protein
VFFWCPGAGNFRDVILRSAERVSKDEATGGASWFETALARLLTMRV